MSFRNSILAGETLIREAVRSQGYEEGVQGWTINADGSAEFNDVVIRGGTVVSGTALYYDGTPGPGTLFLSIAAQAGTDEYGNAYGAGLTVGPVGARQVQLVQDEAGGYISLDHNNAQETFPGSIASRLSAGGAPTQRIVTQVSSAYQTGGGAAAVQIFSGSLDETIPPRVVLVSDTSGVTGVLTADHWQTQVLPGVPSANSALYVEGAAGHTGRLLRVTLDGANRLTVDSDGNVAAAGSVTADNMRAGTAQTASPGGAPGQTSVNVTFTNPMPSTPRVVCTPDSSAANLDTSNIRWATTNESSTGFTLNCWRDTNAATTFNWVALTDTE